LSNWRRRQKLKHSDHTALSSFKNTVKNEREENALTGNNLVDPVSLMFDKQQAVYDDPSKRQVAGCGRRAGKTLYACLKAMDVMQRHPHELVMYVGITKNAAKDIIWRAFEELNDIHKWGLKFRSSDLRAIHPNGAQFVVMGADKISELEKARGPQKIRLAIVDECQSHKPFDLKYLVESILEPGMMDVDGDIFLMGSRGQVPHGYWFDLTTGKRKGWSVHEWTCLDNPHLHDPVAFLAKLLNDRGWDETHPTYRREYKNEWVKDEEQLVFSFDSERNVINFLPAHDDEWEFVLSMDFGAVHSTAWCLWGYGPYGHESYIFRSFKRPGMTPSLVADITKKLVDEWNPRLIVGDLHGLGKAYAVEMSARHGIDMMAANKKDKRGIIEFMADDMKRGVIKSHVENETLHEELESIVWDELHEDIADGQDDHEAEGALYGYQYTPAYANNLLPRQSEHDGLPSYVKRPDENMEEFINRRKPKKDPFDVGFMP